MDISSAFLTVAGQDINYKRDSFLVVNGSSGSRVRASGVFLALASLTPFFTIGGGGLLAEGCVGAVERVGSALALLTGVVRDGGCGGRPGAGL